MPSSAPPQTPAPGSDSAPFAGLTPDLVLNAVDSVGLRTSGQLLALNSYENRVFQVGLEAAHAGETAAPVVVKFYRPERWSDQAIAEEHAFEFELAEREVPAVPPLRLAGGGALQRYQGFRFAVFARRGGRAPELSDPAVLRRIGRFLGRLHEVGGAQRFVHRPLLDPESFGAEPSRYLLEHDWLPPDLREVYRGVVGQALDGVGAAFERAGDVRLIRLHGDCHEGNLLWTDAGPQPGPHFVDFDDSRMGPAVQDLWMLLAGGREEMQQRLTELLEGYQMFAAFDARELQLIEALRTLRLIHYAAWIARRWNDPAFPAAFPWFDTPRYWEARILELREQVAAMQEPPLALAQGR